MQQELRVHRLRSRSRQPATGRPHLCHRLLGGDDLLDANDHDPIIRFRYFPATADFATVDENALDNSYFWVSEIEEKGEFNVIVLSPGGKLCFIRGYKPTKNQKIIPLSHVIIKIQSLKPTTLRNRIFKLPKNEHDNISAKYTCQLANLV